MLKKLDFYFISCVSLVFLLLGGRCKTCGSPLGDAGCVPCNNHGLWGDELPDNKSKTLWELAKENS